MWKINSPIVKLDGFIFDCIRCGECCKVLRKTEVSNKKFLYGYDFQGKLTKSPLTTTTVFYNEKWKICNYIGKDIKIANKNFVPFGSFFLKDFPIEFVCLYQVKVNGEYCIFYRIEEDILFIFFIDYGCSNSKELRFNIFTIHYSNYSDYLLTLIGS